MHVRVIAALFLRMLLLTLATETSRTSKTGLCTLKCLGYRKVIPCFAMPATGCPVCMQKEGRGKEDPKKGHKSNKERLC